MRTLPHAVGGEVDEPITSAVSFKQSFRAQFGASMPDFVEVSHREALRMAQQQLKFLFVYLHSPAHGDAPAFCRDVLTAPAVVAMLSANFVVWGGDVRRTDAFQLAAGVAPSTFPYVALLSSVNSRISLVMACEGPLGADHLAGGAGAPGGRAHETQHFHFHAHFHAHSPPAFFSGSCSQLECAPS